MAARLTDDQKRVRKGARWLDKKLPGWWKRVKTTKLVMNQGWLGNDGCGCILAQAHREHRYSAAARDLGIEPFSDDDLALGLDGETPEEPWIEEIRARRKAARA